MGDVPGLKYHRLMVQRLDGLWDRVRRHQVEDRHAGYYDDERNCWFVVPGKELEFEEAMKSEW